MKTLIVIVGCIVGTLSFRQSSVQMTKQTKEDSPLLVRNLKRQKYAELQKRLIPEEEKKITPWEDNKEIDFPNRLSLFKFRNSRRIDNYKKNMFSFLMPKRNYWQNKFIEENNSLSENYEPIPIKNESPFDQKLIQKLLKRESPLFIKGNIFSIKLLQQGNDENMLQILFTRQYNQFTVKAKYNKDNNIIDIKSVVKNQRQNIQDEDFLINNEDPLDFYREKANILSQFFFPSEETRKKIIEKAKRFKQDLLNKQDNLTDEGKRNVFYPIFNFLHKLKNALRFFG